MASNKTREELIQEIKDLANTHAISFKHPELYLEAIRIFGSWSEALKASGRELEPRIFEYPGTPLRAEPGVPGFRKGPDSEPGLVRSAKTLGARRAVLLHLRSMEEHPIPVKRAGAGIAANDPEALAEKLKCSSKEAKHILTDLFELGLVKLGSKGLMVLTESGRKVASEDTP